MFLAASWYFLPRFAMPVLLSDLHAHAAGRALYHLHSCIDVVGVEVAHLGLGDLAHLVSGQAADLLALLRRRAFLDAGRLLDEVGGRRRLQDEREGAVLKDRDLHRDDAAHLGGSLLVVLL